MLAHPNLISDSLLVSETVELLKISGGRASAVEVVDCVMKISEPDADLARLLVLDLVETDARLHLIEDTLELIENGLENRRLAETEFVVFDLETTGAKTPPCRITEIGAYRIKNGKIVEEFQTLVNPETAIPPFITQLTGISNEMVRDAPAFRAVAHDFLDFIGDACLVAHNASFDLRFLNYEISRMYAARRVANAHLCTVQLSRKLLPHVENHRLKTLAEYFSVALVNHHRAAADAHATARIFVRFLDEMDARGILDLAAAKRFNNNGKR